MQLLRWILGNVHQTAKNKNAEVDSNKQYVSELLAILMQQSEANQRKLAESNGIDIVLQAIARYKNRCMLTSEAMPSISTQYTFWQFCVHHTLPHRALRRRSAEAYPSGHLEHTMRTF